MTKEEIEQNADAYIAEQTGQPWQWRYANCPWTDAIPGTNPVHSHIAVGNRCRPTPPKPEPTVIPWTLETRPIGAVMVRVKTGEGEAMITGWKKGGAWICGFLYPYDELLEDYTLQDGSPCGQVIQP